MNGLPVPVSAATASGRWWNLCSPLVSLHDGTVWDHAIRGQTPTGHQQLAGQGQGPRGLKAQPAPRYLDDVFADPGPAGLGDPLVMIHSTVCGASINLRIGDKQSENPGGAVPHDN